MVASEERAKEVAEKFMEDVTAEIEAMKTISQERRRQKPKICSSRF